MATRTTSTKTAAAARKTTAVRKPGTPPSSGIVSGGKGKAAPEPATARGRGGTDRLTQRESAQKKFRRFPWVDGQMCFDGSETRGARTESHLQIESARRQFELLLEMERPGGEFIHLLLIVQ